MIRAGTANALGGLVEASRERKGEFDVTIGGSLFGVQAQPDIRAKGFEDSGKAPPPHTGPDLFIQIRPWRRIECSSRSSCRTGRHLKPNDWPG